MDFNPKDDPRLNYVETGEELLHIIRGSPDPLREKDLFDIVIDAENKKIVRRRSEMYKRALKELEDREYIKEYDQGYKITQKGKSYSIK